MYVQEMAENLKGIEYIQSPTKRRFDSVLSRLILPAAELGTRATERAIWGTVSPENRFRQVRVGQGELTLEKIKTMRDLEPGEQLDIDRHGRRIVNMRAHFARVVGLDELPQWQQVKKGDMSLVGPRPMLKDCVDRISVAAADVVGSEVVEEWRDFIGTVRPGIFGRSQALRHQLGVDEYSSQISARTVVYDLAYKYEASLGEDFRIIIGSPMKTAYEGLRLVTAAGQSRPMPRLDSYQLTDAA